MPDNSSISQLIADVKEQVLYMQELGVDALETALQSPKSKVQSPKSVDVREANPAIPDLKSEILKTKDPEIAKPKTLSSRLAALPSLSKRERNAPLIPAASSMIKIEAARTTPAEPALIEIASKLEDTMDTIESIRADIGDCTRCKLHTCGRKQIVHTTGNFHTDLMFVGEAPGADEDEQGFPFVGRAGQLLTKIIESIGMSREDVCIGNINRCRPPGNRQPEPDETVQCRPFILREIAVVKPKVIVVLGATAAHNLLQVKTPISKLRGNFQDYFGVKVMPTFHPAYLLRDPNKKREVWEDMKKVREYLAAN
jgi:DNA polymerase